MTMYLISTNEKAGINDAVWKDIDYFRDEEIVENGKKIKIPFDKELLKLPKFSYKGQTIYNLTKNYLNTSQSTIEIDKLNNSDYLVDQQYGKTVYNFDDSTLITAYSNNPQFNMIKNDFIVWGQRKDANDHSWPIRYHLAIDEKPEINKKHLVFKYLEPETGLTMWNL